MSILCRVEQGGNMSETVLDLMLNIGLTGNLALYVSKAVLVVGVILLSFLANLIAKKVILSLIRRIVQKTESKWDDVLFEKGVLTRLSHFAPALVIYFLVPAIFPEMETITLVVKRLTMAYMIGVSILVVDSILTSVHHIYQGFEISKSRPIKGYVQVVKIIVYLVGLILIVTTIMNKSPLGILSGLGAMSAVLLLVFKDSILGFIAGIQLSANQLVHLGDWIEMPKYGADGDVLDIHLQSIKVQYWDKTITTIPIYAFISDSFKNWRGMSESGGRRIKRSICIDMASIRFCTPEMIAKYHRFSLLKEYLDRKLKEIEEERNQQDSDDEVINRRNLTNIGTFRAYLVEYLKHHPKIHNDMTFLVRQLQPHSQGLPLEIYVFSNDQAWANYENIQADIFDHILAAVPEFGLRVFQEPSSYDLAAIAESVAKS